MLKNNKFREEMFCFGVCLTTAFISFFMFLVDIFVLYVIIFYVII